MDADVARVPAGYRAEWSTFDNTTGLSSRIGQTATARTTLLVAPSGLPETEGAFIQVSLSAFGAQYAPWEKPVRVFFRKRNGSWRLVGLERMPEL